MHIVIDVRSLQTPGSRDRGIGYSLRGWLTEFLSMPYAHQVTLMYDPRLDPPQIDVSLSGEFWRAVPFESYPELRLPDPETEQVARRNTERFLLDQEADLFHIPSPFETSAMIGYPPATCRCVATFHDAVMARFPEHYLADPEESFVVNYYAKLQALSYCTHIVAVSQSAADDLVQFSGVTADRIDVVHHAASPEMFIRPRPEEVQRSALQRRIGQPYIFSLLGSNPTKNVERLVAAFCRLPRQLQSQYKLVITYRIPEWQKAGVQAWIDAYQTGDRVVFTDFVSRDELRLLFWNAELYVHPALYEGFGLPVIEAMALGRPVVVSSAGPMLEVVGDAALTFDPYDVDAIAGTMTRVLLDEGLRQDLGRQAAARARQFSWHKAAFAIREIYERAMRVPFSIPMGIIAGGSRAGQETDEDDQPTGTPVEVLQLTELADVADRGYVERSKVPVVGPLIASIRRTLTSHLREPYFDPIIERQVTFNHRLADAVQAAWRMLDNRESALRECASKMAPPTGAPPSADYQEPEKSIWASGADALSRDGACLPPRFYQALHALSLMSTSETIKSQSNEAANAIEAATALARQAEEYYGSLAAFRKAMMPYVRSLEPDVVLRGYQVRSRQPMVGPLIAWTRRNLTSHLREPYLDPILERQVRFNQRVVDCLSDVHTISSADVEPLQPMTDIVLRGYTVRSNVPLVGPFIAYIRRALTSHWREQRVDPIFEGQVRFNRAALAALTAIHQRVVKQRLVAYYEVSTGGAAIATATMLLKKRLSARADKDPSDLHVGLNILARQLLEQMADWVEERL
jgi:glycosyltransferase involved in cell wall biosynthesis